MSEIGRLVRILGLLSSPYDGERAAAALLATREVKRMGMSWAELLEPRQAARPPPPIPQPPDRWRSLLAHCMGQSDRLSSWETEFCRSITRRSTITMKQRTALAGIASRLRTAGR